MRNVRSWRSIMQMQIPKENGILDPKPRLLEVNEMVLDISALYKHQILTVTKDLRIKLNPDAEYTPLVKTGGSIIRQPENNNAEKRNEAMIALEEDASFRAQLYDVFERCFNIFLNEDQRGVYAAKYFGLILKLNYKSGRTIRSKYNNDKRRLLLVTAEEQMIEGLMLDSCDEYGEVMASGIVRKNANARIDRIDPDHKLSYWCCNDWAMMYKAYTQIECLIPQRIAKLIDKSETGKNSIIHL